MTRSACGMTMCRKRETAAQTERHGGVPLPPVYGLNTAAHDLGNEAEV